MPEERPCAHCGTEFEPSYDEQQYCGVACSNKSRSDRDGPSKVTLTCEHCGDDYEKRADRADRSKYCSKDCQYADKARQQDKECEQCGREFSVPPSRSDQRFCSKPCHGEWKEENTETTVVTCDDCGGPRSKGSKSGLCWECRKARDNGRCEACGKALLHYQESFCSKACYGDSRRKGEAVRPCEVCGEPVEQPAGSEKKSCSEECRRTLISEAQGGREDRECPECGTEFNVKSSSDRKYCSQDCYHDSRRYEREERECPICGDTFVVPKGAVQHGDQKYCGRDCFQKHRAAQSGKTRNAKDGHKVRSRGEELIDNWLFEHGIAHAYDTVHEESGLQPDWLLPAQNVAIEFWGVSGQDDYDRRRKKKEQAYEDSNLTLVSVEPNDLDNLEHALSL